MLTLEREVARSEESSPRLRRLALPAVVGAGTLALTAYVAAVDPNQPGHYPLCPTLALAGIYCPGCGMLRATHDLAHGDLAGAMQRNPLAPLVLGNHGRALRRVGGLAHGPVGRSPGPRADGRPGCCSAASRDCFTVLRNVPGWTWLSPA